MNGKGVQYGLQLKRFLEEQGQPVSLVNSGTSQSAEYFQLVSINTSLNSNQEVLQQQVSKLLQSVFFNEQFNLVKKCAAHLAGIINAPQTAVMINQPA